MIVEDSDSDIETCIASSKRYFSEKRTEIEIDVFKNVNDAKLNLYKGYSGAIIDLTFPEKEDGMFLLQSIKDDLFRIPIIVVTGTPDAIGTDKSGLINVLKKGEFDYQTEVFDKFVAIFKTGITEILGGRGRIEQIVNEVFVKNLLPQLDVWIDYGEINTENTKKAILRYTVNHLMNILDYDSKQCYPEEVYFFPALTDDEFKTGSIVKTKEGENYFIILSPPCDLAIRETGEINTDKILFVKITSHKNVIDFRLKKVTEREEQEKLLSNIFNNRLTYYYHWLPETSYFEGGFINFRDIITITKKEFKKNFEKPFIQVSPHFVKDILSRFSSYYARQGQPDIDADSIIERIINPATDK